MTHEAVLTFDYETPERAARVEGSVGPEIGDIEGDRTTATLERSGGAVTLSLTATDLVALRAGINTWSTLVGVAESVTGS